MRELSTTSVKVSSTEISTKHIKKVKLKLRGAQPKFMDDPTAAHCPCVFTCVTPPCAHAGWQQRPLVCAGVVVFHRGQIAGTIIASHHVEETIHCTHTSKQSTDGKTWDNSSPTAHCCHIPIHSQADPSSPTLSLTTLITHTTST